VQSGRPALPRRDRDDQLAHEIAHSTTYKYKYEYIGQFEAMGLRSRNDEIAPTTVTATPIRLQLDIEHGDVLATPTLGRQLYCPY
jgi:hypothetical protein